MLRIGSMLGPTLGAALAAASAAEAAPSVEARDGRIVLVDGGSRTILTERPGDGEPALSPDGRRVAFVRRTGPAGEDDDHPPSELMVCSLPDCQPRALAVGPAPGPAQPSVRSPRWSPDGGTVYVLAMAYVVSDLVVAVDVASGRQRPVIDGNGLSVVRGGRWRGALLVRRHKYLPGPNGGSYDPVDLVRADGSVVLTVPGSQRDDGRDHVAIWLRRHGWTADRGLEP